MWRISASFLRSAGTKRQILSTSQIKRSSWAGERGISTATDAEVALPAAPDGQSTTSGDHTADAPVPGTEAVSTGVATEGGKECHHLWSRRHDDDGHGPR